MSVNEGNAFDMNDICLITPDDIGYFGSILLPGARAMIEAGEPVTALGYVSDQVACAAVAGYIRGNSFEIISFYVAKDYRRRGIGSGLLTALCELVSPFADILSLGFVITEKEHEILEKMINAYGFRKVASGGRNIYKTDIGKLSQSRLFEPGRGKDKGTSFADTNKDVLGNAEKQARKLALPMPDDGFMGENVEMACSMIYLKDDKLQGYIVLEQMSEESLVVTGLANCTDNLMLSMKLICDALEKVLYEYEEETSLYMQTEAEGAKKILLTLDPDAKVVDRRYELIIK